jgi:hypothetical protein
MQKSRPRFFAKSRDHSRDFSAGRKSGVAGCSQTGATTRILGHRAIHLYRRMV